MGMTEQYGVARNLKSVSQFASESVWSEASLRWMIFQASSNGLSETAAIVRVGRRVFIDPDAFDRWIESQNPQMREGDARRTQA